jgi:hypothetical protein
MFSIDLATMAETEDEVLVMYFVDDPVVPGSYSPLAGPADELGASWGPRVGREQIDSGLYATSCRMVELPPLPGRGHLDHLAQDLPCTSPWHAWTDYERVVQAELASGPPSPGRWSVERRASSSTSRSPTPLGTSS